MHSINLPYITLLRRIVTVRMSSTNSSYEDAIRKLNSLQSNKSTLENIKNGLKTGQKCTNIADMEYYLGRVGIPLSRLDELSVIHVAGTKGKGSTSAMCESILRHHGFRTGFYSSPHLVAARERIRLAGRPLSRDEFAHYLHHTYDLLWNSQAFEGDMPKYFAFLTVVAFHVFLQRRVDVAVVEVGIGGLLDYTNVLRKVRVVGITALGLDHTSILGSSLPDIAASKAGVMKRGCSAYTVPQPPDALPVLHAYANRLDCSLTVVPDYKSYIFPPSDKPHVPVDVDAYRSNASLAIQLAHAWMRVMRCNPIQNDSADHENNNLQRLNVTITNDTNTDQSSLTDGDLNFNSIALHSKTVNVAQNGTYKYQNNLTNGNIKSTINGFQGDFTNCNHCDSNKVQNGMTNGGNMHDKHDFNTLRNNHTNKTANGLTNGDIQGKLVYEVPYETADGLRQCKWLGRYQVLEQEYATFYLDGAHTKESVEICAQWFMHNTSSADKCLIFSATGDRDAAVLLRPLTTIPFKRVYFVVPTAHRVTRSNQDNYSLVEEEQLTQRCRGHALFWQENNPASELTVLRCVHDALTCIKALEDKPSVLITGSLHLVGAALSILDPSLSE